VGRSWASSGHGKPLCACVDRTKFLAPASVAGPNFFYGDRGSRQRRVHHSCRPRGRSQGSGGAFVRRRPILVTRSCASTDNERIKLSAVLRMTNLRTAFMTHHLIHARIVGCQSHEQNAEITSSGDCSKRCRDTIAAVLSWPDLHRVSTWKLLVAESARPVSGFGSTVSPDHSASAISPSAFRIAADISAALRPMPCPSSAIPSAIAQNLREVTSGALYARHPRRDNSP
jgi:hypothetical protein